MFRLQKPVVKPLPAMALSARAAALVARMRARSGSDVEIARLLEELAPYLPSTLPNEGEAQR